MFMKLQQAWNVFNFIVHELVRRSIGTSYPFMCQRNRTELSGIMGIEECTHHGSYLGHPFCQFKSRNEAYQETIEKLSNKLSNRKHKTLSMAGRIVLIILVVQLQPSFIMQTTLLPKSAFLKLDKMTRISFGGFETITLITYI